MGRYDWPINIKIPIENDHCYSEWISVVLCSWDGAYLSGHFKNSGLSGQGCGPYGNQSANENHSQLLQMVTDMSVSKKSAKSLAINYANWARIDPTVSDVKTVAMAANSLYGSQKKAGVVLADYDLLQHYMNKDPIWKKCFTC